MNNFPKVLLGTKGKSLVTTLEVGTLRVELGSFPISEPERAFTLAHRQAKRAGADLHIQAEALALVSVANSPDLSIADILNRSMLGNFPPNSFQ